MTVRVSFDFGVRRDSLFLTVGMELSFSPLKDSPQGGSVV